MAIAGAIAGGVRFEKVQKALDTGLKDPVSNARTNKNKANDSAYYETDNMIIVVRGDLHERLRTENEVKRELGIALRAIFPSR